MRTQLYSAAELEELRGISVPTLANALETFRVVNPNSGCCDASIKCRFPGLPAMIGYAVTSKVTTDLALGTVLHGIDEHAYWDFVNSLPGPKVAVCKDVDDPSFGAMWGEFNSNVHRALGCEGAIVDGAVRDLDGVVNLGFRFFSRDVHPSHGNGIFIDYGSPVRIGGLEIETGDLLIADRHGILKIPESVPARELIAAAKEIDRLESEVFAFCQSPGFSVEGLKELDLSVQRRWPNAIRPDGVEGLEGHSH